VDILVSAAFRVFQAVLEPVGFPAAAVFQAVLETVDILDSVV